MKKKSLLFLLTFFSFYLQAQVLASYGFADVTTSTGTLDPTPPPMLIGLTFGSFSATGVSSNPTSAEKFSFSGWPIGAQNTNDAVPTMTATLDQDKYYAVDIIPIIGYSVTISSITFFMRRSGTGIRNYAVRSNLDNYTSNLPASVVTNTKLSVISQNVFLWNYDAAPNTSDQKGSSVVLGAPFYNDLTQVLTFRFYAWNAEQSSGTFGIDSVVFLGTVTNKVTSTITAMSEQMINDMQTIIFPNPCSDKLTIENESEINQIEVRDVLGNVLFNAINPDKYKTELNISSLSAGTYFVLVYSNKKVSRRKFFVVRE